MVAYDKGDLIPVGTRVRVSPFASPYSGQYGVVVPNNVFDRKAWAGTRPRTRLTYVSLENSDKVFGYFTDNLERIEEMTNYNNLVGPKPEPVKEPDHPTPWRRQGRVIIDANGVQVLKVRESSEYETIPTEKAFRLASVLVDAVNALFPASKEDAPSPF